jgi:hypothetical protein
MKLTVLISGSQVFYKNSEIYSTIKQICKGKVSEVEYNLDELKRLLADFRGWLE